MLVFIVGYMKCEGIWCVVLVNVYCVDWIWVNVDVLEFNGIVMFISWDEFNVVVKKL